MKNHHISEAGESFEIQLGLFIKIWAGEHIVLHMAGNYRHNGENGKTPFSIDGDNGRFA